MIWNHQSTPDVPGPSRRRAGGRRLQLDRLVVGLAPGRLSAAPTGPPSHRASAASDRPSPARRPASKLSRGTGWRRLVPAAPGPAVALQAHRAAPWPAGGAANASTVCPAAASHGSRLSSIAGPTRRRSSSLSVRTARAQVCKCPSHHSPGSLSGSPAARAKLRVAGA